MRHAPFNCNKIELEINCACIANPQNATPQPTTHTMQSHSHNAAMNDINEKIKQTQQQQQQQQPQQQQPQEPCEIRDPYGILELWRSRL
jgi:hypothetical protein